MKLSLPLVLLFGLAAGTAGVVSAIESPAPEEAYKRARYLVREALGLEKRWARLPGPESVADRTEIACPPPDEAIVLVTGGQSNAANVISATHDAGEAVSVWFDGRCFPARDPLPGATGRGGSLWSALADRLAARLGRPVLLVNGAVGGTQFGDWIDDRSGYYAALIGRVDAVRQAGYTPDLVLWHQGETDAAAERDMGALERDVAALVSRLTGDMQEAPLYLFRASKCIGPGRQDGVPGVIAAQTRVAQSTERVLAGMDTDTLGRDQRWDTCHFNSRGRDEIVATVMPELAALLSR